MWTWFNLLNHPKVNYPELPFYCALKSEALNWPPFSSFPFEPRLPVLPIPNINCHPFKWRFKSPCCPLRLVDVCHFGRANMSDSKCVCSASCCKIIISSGTVLNYKHVLTVWSVKVNWGKNVDPKTWLFPAGKQSVATPTYFLLSWNRNVPSAHRPEVPPTYPFCFSSTMFELSATSSSMTNKVTGLKSERFDVIFRVPAFNKLEQHWGTAVAGELWVWGVALLALLPLTATERKPEWCGGFITDPEGSC